MGTQHTNMSYSYIERGGGPETFRPFDYLGFRYLQIDDPGETLTTNDIVALTRHEAVPDENAGTFTSSDKTRGRRLRSRSPLGVVHDARAVRRHPHA